MNANDKFYTIPYPNFKSLLAAKSEIEVKLNEISNAIRLFENSSATPHEKSVTLNTLKADEIAVGNDWTRVYNEILNYKPRSTHEAGLKILLLVESLSLSNENDRAIMAIKSCAELVAEFN